MLLFFFASIKWYYRQVCNNSNRTGATSGPATACPSFTCFHLLIWEIWSSSDFLLANARYCLSCDLRLPITHLISSNCPKNTCIIVTNGLDLSVPLFFFTLLFPATFQKLSFCTQAFLYPVPEIVKTLLDDESDAVLEPSTSDKWTISSPPLIQVHSIRYRVLVFNATFNILSQLYRSS